MTDVIAMIGGLGITELLLLLGVAILVFGATRIPEIAKSMGEAIKEFKKAGRESTGESDEDDKDDSKSA